MNAPRWLQRSDDESIGCYVHIPFCDRICPYCDFAVVANTGERVQRYLTALCTEIDRSSPAVRRVQTVYFGGGTPSVLSTDAIRLLCAKLRERFALSAGGVEWTLEANPSRNAEHMQLWRALGVTRLSIGVQSFNDGELHALGREHTAQEAEGFVAAARTAGFDNISLDLIAGAPGQTRQTFQDSLQRAAALGVDHISVYGLTIEAETPYARWHARNPKAFPDDDAVADLLQAAHEMLTDRGYDHYELSNFARPGFECAHNVGYWRQRGCVAFGMSAAGYDDGVRYRNLRPFEAYCAAIEQGCSARDYEERLGAADRIGEAAMLALRMRAGIGYADFRRRFNIEPAAVFRSARERCLAAGLLESDADGVRLNARGRLLANDVCAEFLAPELVVASS